jgi:hypothetical protein
MSVSLGDCLASSIRLVLAGFHPAAADSSRPDRRASRRMPRSRSASCCRARWTLEDGDSVTSGQAVVRVRDCAAPDCPERRCDPGDHGRFIAQVDCDEISLPTARCA